MIQGKTESGFEFKIDEETLNNYEMLENIADLEENPLLVTAIARQLLGSEQTKELKEHVRNEKGIVPINKMTEEITNIFKNGGQEIKNS